MSICKKGRLKPESIDMIEKLIKSNPSVKGRGWITTNQILKSIINDSDIETNKLVLSLMSIFTDAAGKNADFIRSYFKTILE